MRSGNRRARRRGSQRGLAYLGVLLLVFVLGVGAMEAASLWSTTRKHEQEAELLFVGDQIRSAIEHYYNSGPGSQYPQALDDLLKDARVPTMLRHLRRDYPDPLTGKADWGIIKAPGGGIMGVYSQAPGKPLKQGGFEPADEAFENGESYKSWTFIYAPQTPDNDKQAN